MCKSRTQAVDPAEIEDDSIMESNLIISKYEVSTFIHMQCMSYIYIAYKHVITCLIQLKTLADIRLTIV